jgi:hypothetical protein
VQRQATTPSLSLYGQPGGGWQYKTGGVVLQMMWLFQIPKWIGKVYALLTRQQLEGRRGLIKVESSADASFVGTQLSGRIHSCPIHASTSGPNGTTKHGPGTLVIEVDVKSRSKNFDAQWLLAAPGLVGHDADMLFVAPIVVSLARINAPSPSPVASYDQILATAVVKLS